MFLLQKHHQGGYICTADNGVGPKAKSKVMLRVTGTTNEMVTKLYHLKTKIVSHLVDY